MSQLLKKMKALEEEEEFLKQKDFNLIWVHPGI